MKRVFPTQLKVVASEEELNVADESKMGYYDEKGKYSMQIGTRKNRIYFNSPGNWYRHYTFTIVTLPSKLSFAASDLAPVASGGCGAADDELEEGEVPSSGPLGPLIETVTQKLWRIIGAIVKTECGRKVVHQEGDHFVTVSHLNKNQVKQMYYIAKHVLARLGVHFTIQSSWSAPPFYRMDVVDVREKPKRRRKKKAEFQLVGKTLGNKNCIGGHFNPLLNVK